MSPQRHAPKRVLVIKLGPLIEFLQALPAMTQIRRAHGEAEIALLTTTAFGDLAKASGLFDTVMTNGRPKGFNGTARLFGALRRGRFERVYDLQSSPATRNYRFAWLPASPRWIGAAAEAQSLPALERYWRQLVQAGIAEPLGAGEPAPGPDLSWAIQAAMRGGRSIRQQLGLEAPFALLIPGSMPGRPLVRWPAKSYAGLAGELMAKGLLPVVAGGSQESGLAEAIQRYVPQTIILTGRINPVELAALARDAALTVGSNPTYTLIAAFAGSPTVLLQPSDLDPSRAPPANDRLIVLLKEDLADLAPGEVLKACEGMLSRA
jgi:ADP-heptose:LPS heptosyltransferase